MEKTKSNNDGQINSNLESLKDRMQRSMVVVTFQTKKVKL